MVQVKVEEEGRGRGGKGGRLLTEDAVFAGCVGGVFGEAEGALDLGWCGEEGGRSVGSGG